VMNNANVLLSRLNDVMAENQTAIRTTMTNVEQFTAMLNGKSEQIGQTITDVQQGAQSFAALSSKLENSLGNNMDGLTRDARASLQEFGAAMREGRRAAATLNRILEKLEADPRGFLLGGSQVPEYTPRGQ
jgi:phospholipid/cholesterol/gamma-HCH transport system substrate-binding protein